MDGDFYYMTEEEQLALAMRKSLASEPDHYDYGHDRGSTEDEELARALQASINDVGKYQHDQS